LQNLGIFPEFSPTAWGLIFAAASVVFLVIYLTSGWYQWGWLFPIFVAAGLAAIIFLGESGFDGEWIGALFMASIAAPFWLIFLIDRGNWWALIPGWVLAVLTAVILLSKSAAGEILGTLVMFGIALPFLIVYIRNPKQWWAVIPAGVMTTIGLIVLLSALVGSQTWVPRVIAGVLFWGMAAPFAFLWLRREQYPTHWAKYPALGLLAMGLLAMLAGPNLDWLWAVALILAGSWLLLRGINRPGLKG
jgi:hypothetical protein